MRRSLERGSGCESDGGECARAKCVRACVRACVCPRARFGPAEDLRGTWLARLEIYVDTRVCRLD